MRIDLPKTSKAAFQKLEEFGFTLRNEQCDSGNVYLSYSNETDTTRINFLYGVGESFNIYYAKMNELSGEFNAVLINQKLKAEDIPFSRDELVFEKELFASEENQKQYLQTIQYNLDKIRELHELGKLK